MNGVQRILIADDDPAIRASLAFAPELEGSRPGDACLILGYRLPGPDGLSVLARQRSPGVGVPAVVITSNPTRNVKKAAAEAGAELIEKPLLCDALSRGIKSLMQMCPAAA